MRVIPAVDLREGACVQLVGGSYDDEPVRLADPVGVAAGWRDAGFGTLHVVDLDAALGRGNNRSVLGSILSLADVEITVGGGIRTAEQIDDLLGAGAHRVVVGTRAILDPDWLEEMAARFPQRLIVAADVRGRELATRGWTEAGGIGIEAFLLRLHLLPLAAILVTAVHQEGRLSGPDLPLIRDCVGASTLPLIASGGITSQADLRAIRETGAAGAVIGMALYTGVLDPQALITEFGP